MQHNHETFHTKLQVGEVGEALVYSYLQHNWKVEDLRKFITMQAQDVDFRITNPSTGEKYYVEVKTDTHLDFTGNVVLELEFPELGRQGWFNYTIADYVAFVGYHSENIYILSMNDMRDYIAQGHPYLKQTTNYRVGTQRVILLNLSSYANAGYHIQHVKKEMQP